MRYASSAIHGILKPNVLLKVPARETIQRFQSAVRVSNWLLSKSFSHNLGSCDWRCVEPSEAACAEMGLIDAHCLGYCDTFPHRPTQSLQVRLIMSGQELNLDVSHHIRPYNCLENHQALPHLSSESDLTVNAGQSAIVSIRAQIMHCCCYVISCHD